VGFVDLLSGRLDGERLAELLDHVVAAGDVGHWWLCGPLGLVDTVTEGLLRRGIPPSAVHSELFFTGAAPPPAPAPGAAGPQVSVTLRLAGRTSTVGIPATATILDGALRSHSDLPFACRSGVCGTCRAKVVDGEVRQRRSFALGPKDRSDGFVLTCQAVPASDCITVDYDA
jgi:ring-1,2-phenylacetyl-CoA epoxidase subunit PaaE